MTAYENKVDEGPIDDAATSRPRAGLIMKDPRELPGLVLIGLAVAAFVACLTAGAMESSALALGSAVAAVVLVVVGIAALFAARRGVARPAAGRHAR